MARHNFQGAIVLALFCLISVGGAATRIVESINHGPLKSTPRRHLLAHIQQEELRHIGRGLRAADDTYSYGNYDGFKNWGGICQQGDTIPQAPIDIPSKNFKEALDNPTGDLDFNYANFTGATATNTGHGVQVNVPGGNILTIGDQKWQLLQYHFHSPSENAIKGRLASMEIHLVHSNVDTGDLAVVGVLMNALDARNSSSYSSALAQGLAKAPATINEESEPFILSIDTFTSLLTPTGALPEGSLTGAGSVPAVTFTGSLTTPPCTAGVQWYVLMKASPVGASQVLSFQRFLGNGTTLSQNNRPTQRSLRRDITSVIVLKAAAGEAPGPSMENEAAPKVAPSGAATPGATPAFAPTVAAPAVAPVVAAPAVANSPVEDPMLDVGGAGGAGAPLSAAPAVVNTAAVPAEEGLFKEDPTIGVVSTGGAGGEGGAGGGGGSLGMNGANGADGADGANGVSGR